MHTTTPTDHAINGSGDSDYVPGRQDEDTQSSGEVSFKATVS